MVKTGIPNPQKMTIGCATKIGSPYDSRIFTFNGTNSFDAESTAVQGFTFDLQNEDELARKKNSFKLE